MPPLPERRIPDWALQATRFISITRTDDELSIIAAESFIPNGTQCERDWSLLKLEGPFEFGLIGVLTSVADPLRDAGIGILALSTFDTDYFLVKRPDVQRAIAALHEAGHFVHAEEGDAPAPTADRDF